MSKIYEALKMADREGKRELKKVFPFTSKIDDGVKGSDQEETHDSTKAARVASDQRLVSFFQPGPIASEQFRKLRTFLFRYKSTEFPRTIMVTSATDMEGKTFVSANLAAGIASDLHAHALLVDCDLRKSDLAQWFRLQNIKKGLSDYLIGDGEISELLMKTEIEKLRVITGGTVQDNPAELIGSKKMETLIHELKSRDDDRFLIFDSTPLLATSEPEVLAKLVDGIIIVVKAGVTPRETVKQAIASLEKEKIIGFVLNDVQFKSPGLSSRYFGSGGYYYRYGYGFGKENSNHQSKWKKIFRFVRKPD